MIDTINGLINRKSIRIVIIAILSLMAAVSLIKGCMNAARVSQDFQWDAAKALSLNLDPYMISMHPDEKIEVEGLREYYSLYEQAGTPQKMEANQFPSLLMLLIPYTMMRPLTARYAWLISNLIFTAIILAVLRATFLKNADRFCYAAVCLLIIAGTPYRNQLGVGQHTVFAFCFFLLAVFFDSKEEAYAKVLTPICLFICFFKYTVTAPLAIYFIYKKRILSLITAVLGHVAFTIMWAIRLNRSIADMIIEPLKVASNLSSEGGLDLGAVFGGSVISYVLLIVIGLGLVIIAVRMEEGHDNWFFAVLIMWSLILMYHRTYDFFILGVSSAMFITDGDKVAKTKACKGRYYYPLLYYYVVVLLAVFFGLRIFSENIVSRICVGTLYYILTVISTIVLIMQSGNLKRLKETENEFEVV